LENWLNNFLLLKLCNKLEIPAGQFHIYSNPTNNKSITIWKFEGDITGLIEDIRDNFKKIL